MSNTAPSKRKPGATGDKAPSGCGISVLGSVGDGGRGRPRGPPAHAGAGAASAFHHSSFRAASTPTTAPRNAVLRDPRAGFTSGVGASAAVRTAPPYRVESGLSVSVPTAAHAASASASASLASVTEQLQKWLQRATLTAGTVVEARDQPQLSRLLDSLRGVPSKMSDKVTVTLASHFRSSAPMLLSPCPDTHIKLLRCLLSTVFLPAVCCIIINTTSYLSLTATPPVPTHLAHL
jgi:hypothetical protein